MGTLLVKVDLSTRTKPYIGSNFERIHIKALSSNFRDYKMSASRKTYTALDLLKLSPANSSQVVVKLPQEFYDVCDVVMPGATKAYNKNQEPSLTLEEITKDLFEKEEVRIAKKHKNYLRRQRAKLAKQARKQEAAVSDTSSEKSVTVVKEESSASGYESGSSNSPVVATTRDCTGVDIAILAPQKFPKANNTKAKNNSEKISSSSATPRVYKNSRLNVRRTRIGSRS